MTFKAIQFEDVVQIARNIQRIYLQDIVKDVGMKNNGSSKKRNKLKTA